MFKAQRNMTLFHENNSMHNKHVKKSLKYFTLCPPRNQFSGELWLMRKILSSPSFILLMIIFANFALPQPILIHRRCASYSTHTAQTIFSFTKERSFAERIPEIDFIGICIFHCISFILFFERDSGCWAWTIERGFFGI